MDDSEWAALPEEAASPPRLAQRAFPKKAALSHTVVSRSPGSTENHTSRGREEGRKGGKKEGRGEEEETHRNARLLPSVQVTFFPRFPDYQHFQRLLLFHLQGSTLPSLGPPPLPNHCEPGLVHTGLPSPALRGPRTALPKSPRSESFPPPRFDFSGSHPTRPSSPLLSLSSFHKHVHTVSRHEGLLEELISAHLSGCSMGVQNGDQEARKQTWWIYEPLLFPIPRQCGQPSTAAAASPTFPL